MLSSEHIGKYLEIQFYDHWFGGVGPKQFLVKARGILVSLGPHMAIFEVWEAESDDTNWAEENAERFGVLVGSIVGYRMAIFEDWVTIS